jgi:hypothetical protein
MSLLLSFSVFADKIDVGGKTIYGKIIYANSNEVAFTRGCGEGSIEKKSWGNNLTVRFSSKCSPPKMTVGGGGFLTGGKPPSCQRQSTYYIHFKKFHLYADSFEAKEGVIKLEAALGVGTLTGSMQDLIYITKSTPCKKYIEQWKQKYSIPSGFSVTKA